ncbi:MAG TPA: L-rhamnose/proton symporter RhaT [Opitutaceae bacterium]|nr:L-rhamnose/proton symporter RhaT [Opitutaceae bacterium]
MDAPAPAPLLGTGLHAIGAGSAALCYAPQRYVRGWSWQTYWLVQAAGCWLILPWIGAALTVPHLGAVLAEAPRAAMLHSYLLGVAYGVGGIAFGVAIRYIGYSLTYAVAIGFSCVLGTLLPPALHGTLGSTLASTAGLYVVAGVFLGAAAMVVTGLAGLRKERETGGADAFNARVGLPICFLAGVLSAVFGLSLDAGQPVADVAARHGAGIFQGNVIYLFSNTGAFTTTLAYVVWLATRGRTWGEFGRAAAGGRLGRNYALSALTGLLWYLQFFFYGLGHVHMGRFQFSSWAIHMIILILFSTGFGVAIGEWRRCRNRTRFLVATALLLLFLAVGLITRGNQLAAT